MFLLPAFTRLEHECQDLFRPCVRMHVCTDYRLRFILSSERVSLGGGGGGGVEPILTPRGESPRPQTFSSEDDRINEAASGRTASPTHYKRAIPAPYSVSAFGQHVSSTYSTMCAMHRAFHSAPLLTCNICTGLFLQLSA